MSLVLVLGGTRSGKSETAESLAFDSGAPVVYVATASATDAEMVERIARHRARRPAEWRTLETADLTQTLALAGNSTLLVDGIGSWIAGMMHAQGLFTDADVAPPGEEGERARDRVLERVHDFAEAAALRPALTVVVAEESGLGLVPTGSGSRRYLDLAGEAAQLLATHSDRALFVVAGQPLELKEPRIDPVPADLRVHGDTVAWPGSLDFAVNVVPGGPPDGLREQLRTALDQTTSYPNERAAVQALAERHARPSEEILPLNGSAEAFWLLARALHPRRAVVVHPSFTEPEVALRASGGRVERVFRNGDDFSLDPRAVPAGADVVFVCNPSNPTGTLDHAGTLARIAQDGRVLVVDEAFMEFSCGEPESLAGRQDIPGLVVVRSLTKVWSLPGIRAGYLVAPAEIAAALKAVRQPWSVNALALAALTACAQDEATPRKIAEEIAAARNELTASLADLHGVRVWPSAANFLLIRVPTGGSVRAALAARGIAVRRADTFPGLTADDLRIAVRRPEENRVLVEALREVLA